MGGAKGDLLASSCGLGLSLGSGNVINDGICVLLNVSDHNTASLRLEVRDDPARHRARSQLLGLPDNTGLGSVQAAAASSLGLAQLVPLPLHALADQRDADHGRKERDARSCNACGGS